MHEFSRQRRWVVFGVIAAAAAAFGVTVAGAASIGGWRVTQQSAGTAILGWRANLTTGNNAMVPGSSCLILFRVVMEDKGTADSAGLIQTGLGRTKAGCGLDRCGIKTAVRSYMEWKPVTPRGDDYTCRWFGPHGTNSSKRYAVAKTSPGSQCAGCYTAFIGGSPVGPGEVSLASSNSAFSSADFATATGEVSSDSTAQEGFVTYGKQPGTTQIPLQRATTLCCSGTNWVTITSPAYCQNPDRHWNLVKPFVQPFWVKRRVASGPICP